MFLRGGVGLVYFTCWKYLYSTHLPIYMKLRHATPFILLLLSSSSTNALEVSSTVTRAPIGTIRTTGVENVVSFNFFCEFVLPFLRQASVEVHPAWCGGGTGEADQAADVTNISGEGAGLEMSQQLGQGEIQSNELLQSGFG